MYLYKNNDGTIVPAPADFSPESPDFDALADVEEVLFVSKSYIKQLRLVVKPKEERDAIRAGLEREEAAAAEEAAADAAAEKAAAEATRKMPDVDTAENAAETDKKSRKSKKTIDPFSPTR